MNSFRTISVALEKLLLDPNNYRFRDLPDHRKVNEQRFSETTVQDTAIRRMRSNPGFGVRELKDSIRSNGYMPIDQVFVKPYGETEDGLYVVVEGNRRIAAIQWLLEEHASGAVDLEDATLASLRSPTVLVLNDPNAYTDEMVQVVMAIRHVSGIKEWGTYQQASLVTQLRDSGLDSATVGERLAMSAREVTRRYRAAKALDQMRQDEDYGEFVTPEIYGIFHEVISIPELRDTWLEWDNESLEFKNSGGRGQLYALISPRTNEEGDIVGDPKIVKGEQARKLRNIYGNEEAFSKLAQDDSTFDEAYAIAYADERDATALAELTTTIAKMSSLLERLSTSDLRALDESHLSGLRQLTATIESTIRDRERLLSD